MASQRQRATRAVAHWVHLRLGKGWNTWHRSYADRRTEATLIEGVAAPFAMMRDHTGVGATMAYWRQVMVEVKRERRRKRHARRSEPPQNVCRCIKGMEEVPESAGTTKALRLSGWHSWTLEMWVYVFSINSRREHGILSAVQTPAPGYSYQGHNDGLYFVLRSSEKGEAPLKATLGFTFSDLVGETPIRPGVWHHLGFVYDADKMEQRIQAHHACVTELWGGLFSSAGDGYR